MSAVERAQSVVITDLLREPERLAETDDDLWVFGYGSLMWRPDFDYRIAVATQLFGWHRRFTLLSIKAWGTEERPGLSAALHPGGQVKGVAFAVPPEARDATLAGLYRREAAYRPLQVQLRTVHGKALRALTFVEVPGSPRFLKDPSADLQAQHITQGVGPRGTSLSYLEETVRVLDEIGSVRTGAHRLLDHVRRHKLTSQVV